MLTPADRTQQQGDFILIAVRLREMSAPALTCSCIPFVDESSSPSSTSSSSSSSSQIQLTKHNLTAMSVQVLSINLISSTSTDSEAVFSTVFAASQTFSQQSNQKQQQQHPSLWVQIEACSNCGSSSSSSSSNGRRSRISEDDKPNPFYCILSTLFRTDSVGECQMKLLIEESKKITIRGILLPLSCHRGVLVTYPSTDIPKSQTTESTSLSSLPVSFHCSSCGFLNSSSSSVTGAAQGGLVNHSSTSISKSSSTDSNIDTLNEESMQGSFKRRRKLQDCGSGGSNHGLNRDSIGSSSSSSSSRRGEQLLQAAGRLGQKGGRESRNKSHRPESKKGVERNERAQDSLKMKLNETRSAHQMNDEFLISPDVRDMRRTSTLSTASRSSSSSSTLGSDGNNSCTDALSSAVTTPASASNNGDQLHHWAGDGGNSSGVNTSGMLMHAYAHSFIYSYIHMLMRTCAHTYMCQEDRLTLTGTIHAPQEKPPVGLT